MVHRVSRIGYAQGKRPPERFELVWKPELGRLEVWGDGDLLDATAYDDGGLIPSQSMAEGAGAAQGGGGMGE